MGLLVFFIDFCTLCNIKVYNVRPKNSILDVHATRMQHGRNTDAKNSEADRPRREVKILLFCCFGSFFLTV